MLAINTQTDFFDMSLGVSLQPGQRTTVQIAALWTDADASVRQKRVGEERSCRFSNEPLVGQIFR